MKLVEPFRSAQWFFFWKGGCADDITQDGDRTFYKAVKRGIFFKKRVLLVWKQELEKWKPSSHKKPPTRLAYEGMVIEIDDKDRMQIQEDTLSEQNLSEDDRERAREQAFFVARKAVINRNRAAHERSRRESFKNNNTDKQIDAFIRKNRTG
jgi:hypothetical protein